MQLHHIAGPALIQRGVEVDDRGDDDTVDRDDDIAGAEPLGARRAVVVGEPDDGAVHEVDARCRQGGLDRDAEHRARPDVYRGRALPARMVAAIAVARSIGMAKPLIAVASPERAAVEVAAIRPMTRPSASTSGPPESPGCTAADTSMVSGNVSPSKPALLVAVMRWPSATTWPAAACGMPPNPRALPTATVASPTRSVAGSPIGAGTRPAAPSSRSTAMSSVTS